ncbi:MAG: transcriptional regulator [Gammaproteobacteria bacterium]|nr:transcriptional regulator [Gammaproteobacteria bacterium]
MLLKQLNSLRTHLFTLGVTIVLLIGWSNRDSNYLSAETGAGYVLGIVGGSLMLILLLYPVSKHVKLLSRIMSIRTWFVIHMLFGIIGPVLILFHSNFQLGSANSSIALICMLLVAFSGLIGRYIYTRIHHGLYGSRKTLTEFKQKTENEHSELLSLYAQDEELTGHLKKLEEKALQSYSSLTMSLWHAIYLAFSAPILRRRVLRLLKKTHTENGESKSLPDREVVARCVKRYTLAHRQIAAFSVYERLFSLWHILHFPLFIMMIITAVIHIFAVHLY